MMMFTYSIVLASAMSLLFGTTANSVSPPDGRGHLSHRVNGPLLDPKRTTDAVRAPKTNVWRDLSEEEVHNVTQWLLGQRDLNLTDPHSAGPWSNTM